MSRDAPAPLFELIAAGERASGGVIGVAATVLATGRHIGFREDELFPAASVIKLPILVALYEEVVRGTVDLTERVTYRAAGRVAGSGVLQDLDDGLALTVRDLATLMITVSDNTATDLLLERVGKDAVEATMRRQDLHSVRIPFSIRELLMELVDMDHRGPGGYEELRRRLRVSAGSGGRSVIAEESDRATPRDLCRLLELLESRAILDGPSCGAILDTLQRTKADTRIPALLPKGTIVAHKTGTIRGVRNDVGVVYGPSGVYALAILSRGRRPGRPGRPRAGGDLARQPRGIRPPRR
ncbi:MAG: class A beta-lactamase-related serine hydrolase [Chloroflexota bacterium]|nr:class A beta-lactamase-related serine hydrolase [Chloroflexota bacterium]